MAEATVSQINNASKASKWALIKEMFAEMDRLIVQMKRDREEINRLTPIIQANIEETRVILDRLAAS